jgi:hypothetical protein
MKTVLIALVPVMTGSETLNTNPLPVFNGGNTFTIDVAPVSRNDVGDSMFAFEDVMKKFVAASGPVAPVAP